MQPHSAVTFREFESSRLTVRFYRYLKPYRRAAANLFKSDGELKKDSKEYIDFIQIDERATETPIYDYYLDGATRLATLYVRAACEIYEAKRLGQAGEKRFKTLVSNSDLGAPLNDEVLVGAESIAGKLQLM